MVLTIDDYKEQYKQAKIKGDSVGMQSANDGANAIRASQGVALQVANKDIASVSANSQNSVTQSPTASKQPATLNTPVTTSANPHQEWINNPNSGLGGMDSYTQQQQEKFYQAGETGDQALMDRVVADSKRVGYDLNLTGRPTDSDSGLISEQIPTRDYTSEMDAIKQMIKGNSDAYYQTQKGQLEANLAKQIADLEIAYNSAVEEGKLSVKEAERQFGANKADLKKQAYLQSEQTKAYGNDMGIQHSQQMVGLQQGDNQRMNSMNNQNMNERDNRVNTLKDRINAITKEKGIQTTLAKAQQASALTSAQGESMQMYNQGMNDLMQKELFTKMEQGHDFDLAGYQNKLTQDNMQLEDKFKKDNDTTAFNRQLELVDKAQTNELIKMAINQGYTVDNMSQEQIYKLEFLGESNKLAVENMKLQHGFDLDMLEQQILGQLKTIDRQASHTASENALDRSFNANQNALNRSASASENAKNIASQAKQIRDYVGEEQARYDLQLERDLKGITPGTKEYDVIVGRNKLESDAGIKKVVTEKLNEQSYNTIINNPLLTKDIGKRPTESKIDIMNIGLKKKQAQWDADKKAIDKAKKDLANLKKIAK